MCCKKWKPWSANYRSVFSLYLVILSLSLFILFHFLYLNGNAKCIDSQ